MQSTNPCCTAMGLAALVHGPVAHCQPRSYTDVHSILKGQRLMLIRMFYLFALVNSSRSPVTILHLEPKVEWKNKEYLKYAEAYPWERFDNSEGNIFGTPFKAKILGHPTKVAFIEQILCVYILYKLNLDRYSNGNHMPLREIQEFGATAPELYETLLSKFMARVSDCKAYVIDHMPGYQDTQNMQGDSLLEAANHVLKWFQLNHKYESMERTSFVEDLLCGDDYICITGSMFLKCILEVLLPNGSFRLRSGSIGWNGHMILSVETENGPVFLESVMSGFENAKTSKWKPKGLKIRLYGSVMKMINKMRNKYATFEEVSEGASIAQYFEQDLGRFLLPGEIGRFSDPKESDIVSKLVIRIAYSEWKKNGKSDDWKTLDKNVAFILKGTLMDPSNKCAKVIAAKRKRMYDFINDCKGIYGKALQAHFIASNECCKKTTKICGGCSLRFHDLRQRWYKDELRKTFFESGVKMYDYYASV